MKVKALAAVVAAFAFAPSLASAQDLTIYNFAHVPAKRLKQTERDITQAATGLDHYWGSGSARFVKHGGWAIYLRSSDKSMDPAGGSGVAIGYHFIDYYSRPFAVVWTGAMAMYGYPWQGILDHEVKEMLVDPQTTRLMGPGAPNVGYIAEVCDPVPDWSYAGNMQDFVTPAWFGNGSGPWDGMRMLHKPQSYSWTGGENYWDGTQWVQRFHANITSHRHATPPPPTIQRLEPR